MFKVNSKQILFWVSIIFAVVLTSCSTLKEAKLDASVPSEAIEEVEAKQRMLISDQLDLISPKTFYQGVSKLNEARDSLKSQEDASKTMTLASQAMAFFQEVEKNADKKDRVPYQILDARKAAWDAIGNKNKKLNNELFKADNKLRHETKDFSQNLENDEFTEIQKNYLDLQVKGVQNNNLLSVRQVIENAEADKASKLAPSTLKSAKRNLVAAENLIAANVNNPSAYEEEVADAKESAKLLRDVMNKSKEMGKGTTEKVALNLVYQDRKIGKLSSDIDVLEGSLESASTEAAEASDLIVQKEQKLEDVSREVRFQKAMNDARKEFDEDEAIVYQQGNKLIIRLKKIGFNTGSAELPGNSMKLLSKVDNVIKNIGAEKVLVEGHTDSTGSNSINQKLSQDRAESVANYLRSIEKDLEIVGEGLGESKPLASNESKEGRALNRRVDIVVTVVK